MKRIVVWTKGRAITKNTLPEEVNLEENGKNRGGNSKGCALICVVVSLQTIFRLLTLVETIYTLRIELICFIVFCVYH